ncbi:MAG: hypothetical protein LBC02_00985 [Planctomycetaceae bacterium]|jgi:hypothetical protein|nr:hypothetical protein [Planctomycetaceae bacterium]
MQAPIGQNRYGSEEPVSIVYVKNNQTVKKDFGPDYYKAKQFYTKLVREGFVPHVVKTTKTI